MRAIILAAGFGTRLKPLTDKTPKPLLKIKNKSILENIIISLKQADITEIVINLHHLKDQIINEIGYGDKFGVKITYSIEDEILDSGGGIANALYHLGQEPFIVINGDIYTDYNFAKLKSINLDKNLGYLVIKNCDYKQDFSFKNNYISLDNPDKIFCGISLINPIIFENLSGKFSLTPILKKYIQLNLMTGEVYNGMWHNIDSLEILKKLNTA